MPRFDENFVDDEPEPQRTRLRKPKPERKEHEPARWVDDGAVPARPLTALDPGQFGIEISNPQVLRMETATVGRILRFTLTWALRHPELGLLGCAHDGCLFTRSTAGLAGYRWALPSARRGQTIIHSHMIFPDLYTYVLRFLITQFGGQVGPEDARWK